MSDKSYSGSIKVSQQTPHEQYRTASKLINKLAVDGIGNGCCVCRTKESGLLLLHVSSSIDEGMNSIFLCEKCSMKMNVHDLVMALQATVNDNIAMKNNHLQ